MTERIGRMHPAAKSTSHPVDYLPIVPQEGSSCPKLQSRPLRKYAFKPETLNSEMSTQCDRRLLLITL